MGQTYKGFDAGTFEIARVQRSDNVIVNVEMATQEWLDANADDPDFLFAKMPDKDGNMGYVMSKYDPETGLFKKQPSLGPFEYQK